MNALGFDPKSVVSACAARGLCSAPKFTPPRSDNEIKAMRYHARLLTSRGTEPVKPSEVHGVPQKVVDLLKDFLRQFTAPFTPLDFQLFLSRSGITLEEDCVRLYLRRAAHQGVLNNTTKGKPGVRAQFQAVPIRVNPLNSCL